MLTSSFPAMIHGSGLRPPEELTLSITPFCNLHCAHCWPEAGPDHIGTPVDVALIADTVEQWVAAGLKKICLTGGEPLTHPDWRDIVEFCCQLTGLAVIRLQTNGTLLTQAAVQFLKRSECERLIFQVSLDGAEAVAHDRVRGQGGFNRALRGLRLLAAAGLGARTTVAFTEMAHNFDQLPRLLELLEEIGIARLVSGTLVRAGRAGTGGGLEMPTPDQYRRLIAVYQDDADFRRRYRKMGNSACLEWLAGRLTATSPTGCTCMQTPYLTADGNLYPCVLMPLPRYAVQRAWRRPLRHVLEEATVLWAELPEIQRRRTQALFAYCGGCPGQRHCGGGCMGRAVSTTGDLMQAEDRCALRRAVYSWPDA